MKQFDCIVDDHFVQITVNETLPGLVTGETWLPAEEVVGVASGVGVGDAPPQMGRRFDADGATAVAVVERLCKQVRSDARAGTGRMPPWMATMLSNGEVRLKPLFCAGREVAKRVEYCE